MSRLALAVLFVVAFVGPAAADDETSPLAASLAEFNAHARFPLPTLDDGQLGKLAAGKVVRLREKSDDGDAPQRIVGLLLTQQTREQLWVGAMDPHFVSLDELTEHRISPDGDWPTRWYQYLELPWPFSARHWIVDVMNSHDLATATEGRGWEHWWDLTENGEPIAVRVVQAGHIPGIDGAMADDAIWTPVNRGAWLTIQVPGAGTILGYHVTTVIGGNIPDRSVADYALLTMTKLLRGAEGRARDEVKEHYGADHEPLPGGDGRPLPPQ